MWKLGTIVLFLCLDTSHFLPTKTVWRDTYGFRIPTLTMELGRTWRLSFFSFYLLGGMKPEAHDAHRFFFSVGFDVRTWLFHFSVESWVGMGMGTSRSDLACKVNGEWNGI
jgi:hypothetical protein